MFEILYNSDITKFKGDVIINSVGVTSTIYGGVCGAILKAADSKELEQTIKSINDIYQVGEYFITEGYGLPSKNILHLVTPNYKNDKRLALYKQCIVNILNECRYRKLKTIGIPKIGTGANGYDSGVVEKILIDMCGNYCKCYPDMNIVLVLPDETTKLNNKRRIRLESYSTNSPHDLATEEKFSKGSKIFEQSFEEKVSKKYDKNFFGYDSFESGREDITIKNFKNIKTIGDYVDAFIAEYQEEFDPTPSRVKIIQRIHRYFAFGKKGKDSYLHNGSDRYGEIKNKNTADKALFFKIMFALKMKYWESETFLNHFGYCFSKKGVNKTDDAVKYLIEKRYYGIVEIEQHFKKEGIKSLFVKN